MKYSLIIRSEQFSLVVHNDDFTYYTLLFTTHHIFVYELSFVINSISTVTSFAMFLEQTFKETHLPDVQVHTQ